MKTILAHTRNSAAVSAGPNALTLLLCPPKGMNGRLPIHMHSPACTTCHREGGPPEKPDASDGRRATRCEIWPDCGEVLHHRALGARRHLAPLKKAGSKREAPEPE